MLRINADPAKGPSTWQTVKKEAVIEFSERKSRFIGICLPISGSEEAEQRLALCRQTYPDATHHVYAWQHIFPFIGGKYSDDGEPKGTAGMPVLDVLRKRKIDQAQILVVRYFGGILLGAGGLVRAYSQAASLAVDAAQILTMARRERYHILAPYAVYDLLRYRLAEAGYAQSEAQFGLDVEWLVAVKKSEGPALQSLVADLSQGEALCTFYDMDYAPLM